MVTKILKWARPPQEKDFIHSFAPFNVPSNYLLWRYNYGENEVAYTYVNIEVLDAVETTEDEDLSKNFIKVKNEDKLDKTITWIRKEPFTYHYNYSAIDF